MKSEQKDKPANDSSEKKETPSELLEGYSFDEFKLIHDSAERVTDRRISLNKFNYSICTALFLAIAFIWNWALTNAKYDYAGIFIALVLAIIATIFTFHWIRQIKDYKSLNTAKFQVMNEMSQRLAFSSDDLKMKIKSFEPFLKEWEALKELSAVQEEKKFKITALKSSNLEYFIPRAFRAIFVILAFLSLIAVFSNLSQFLEAIKGILLVK